MTISYKDSVRNTRLDSLTSAIGTAGVLEIFQGAPTGKTAGVYNADPTVRLASLPMSNPAAPASSSGVLTFSTITAAAALASGTPASFRIKTANAGAPATVIIEGTAGIGTGDLNFTSTIGAGGTVSITSAAITEANA